MKTLVEIRDLLVQRNGAIALQLEQLLIFEGEVLAVVGPNGAGKSTLLLTLARLIEPQGGQILFDGQRIDAMQGTTYRRRIALGLQDPLLFDSSVFENVALGLRFRGVARNEIQRRVSLWLERLGVASLAARRAGQLSGGEAQRVSLARALALEPQLLLLDEPFAALDPPTRSRLLDDLSLLLRETATTTVFVTHDLSEAVQWNGRIAVMAGGRLRQVGSPAEVLRAPVDEVVAAFLGIETMIPGRVMSQADGCLLVDAAGMQLEAVGEVAVGREVFFCLRPEDVTLWRGANLPPSSARNRLNGQITRLTPQGALVRITVECRQPGTEAGLALVALVTRPSAQEMALAQGVPVTLTFKASAAHLIPR
jgi:tungstate transport system ATP-binding protein